MFCFLQVINEHVDGPTNLTIPGYDTPVMFGEIAHFSYPVVDSGWANYLFYVFWAINILCLLGQ